MRRARENRATARAARCRCCAASAGRCGPTSAISAGRRRESSTAPNGGKSVAAGGKSVSGVPGGCACPVWAGRQAVTWFALPCDIDRTTASRCAICAVRGSISLNCTPGKLVGIAPNSPRTVGWAVGLRIERLLLRMPAVQKQANDLLRPAKRRLLWTRRQRPLLEKHRQGQAKTRQRRRSAARHAATAFQPAGTADIQQN